MMGEWNESRHHAHDGERLNFKVGRSWSAVLLIAASQGAK